MDETVVLKRYSSIRLTVPPRQVFVVEAQQIEPLPDIRFRPDLAIGAIDLRPDEGRASVAVHNIGGADAPEGVLGVFRHGRPAGRAPVPPLKAPLDLAPSRAQVLVDVDAPLDGLLFRVSLPGDAPEITLENNEARL